MDQSCFAYSIRRAVHTQGHSFVIFTMRHLKKTKGPKENPANLTKFGFVLASPG